jgi:hypothetical protein
MFITATTRDKNRTVSWINWIPSATLEVQNRVSGCAYTKHNLETVNVMLRCIFLENKYHVSAHLSTQQQVAK